MTRKTNAKVAGVTFLVYIAVAMLAMILHGRAARGEDVVAQLTSIGEHAFYLRWATVFDLLCGFSAIILGVTLYALTRDVDADVARLGMVFRVAEGIVGGISVQGGLGLIWLSEALRDSKTNTEATNTIAAWLLGENWTFLVSATFFAAGSTAFAWLFLRGRMIPVALAWLGLIASVLVVIALPLQMAGVLPGSVVQVLWIPMAAFEVPLAIWLIVKGAALPRDRVA
jgi:Domain of unknown function (DUF4386)